MEPNYGKNTDFVHLNRKLIVKKILILDYVEEVFQTVESGIQGNNLETLITEFEVMAPEPMNRMLEQQPKEEAIQKREMRKNMNVQDVQPTIRRNAIFRTSF